MPLNGRNGLYFRKSEYFLDNSLDVITMGIDFRCNSNWMSSRKEKMLHTITLNPALDKAASREEVEALLPQVTLEPLA